MISFELFIFILLIAFIRFKIFLNFDNSIYKFLNCLNFFYLQWIITNQIIITINQFIINLFDIVHNLFYYLSFEITYNYF